MNAKQIGRTGRLRRAVPVLVAVGLASAAMLAGGVGQAAAASHTGGAGKPHAGRAATAGTISTVAGGVGGPAKAVALDPCGVVAAAGGSLYIADTTAVRKLSPDGWLTTPAGTGTYLGPSGSGGPAASADVDTCGVARDHSGNLVIAEADEYLAQGGQDWVGVVAAKTGTFYGQAMTAGDFYTVAGEGTRGESGSGGLATHAKLTGPTDVAVAQNGNLVLADSGYQLHKRDKIGARLQVIAVHTGRSFGQAMTKGHIYTVAGYLTGITVSGDGGPATAAGLGRYIGDVRVDPAGNLVFADSDANAVRVVAASSGMFYGQSMTAGDIYSVAGDGTYGFSGDGGPATSAELNDPSGVALDAAGNLVIADSVNYRIRVVAASSGTFYGQSMTAGDIYTVAGDGTMGSSGNGGPATSAELSFPDSVAVDGAGNLVLADQLYDGQNDVGLVRVVAASSGTFYGKPMTAGDIYRVAGNGSAEVSGDGGPATEAEFAGPYGVAVDGAGNLLIADYAQVRAVAASTGTFYGKPMTAGDVYSIAGNGKIGSSGDGGPATRAELGFSTNVTVDGSGNLVIADTNNGLVRVVAASSGTFYGARMKSGDIYTVAADLDQPTDVAVDGSGNLVIAAADASLIQVRASSAGTFYGQPMKAGKIYTVAGDGTTGFAGDGGPATSAELNFASGVAVDAAGNLVITDFANERVRVVAVSSGTFYGQSMTAGDIYTVAGDGTQGFSGDGGPATSAGLDLPEGVAVDSAGNLVVADSYNNRVRVIAASTATFYGQPMISGDIYTVAGNGTQGFSGDGGPAITAELNVPGAVAVNAQGDLLITGNRRIRMVTG
jgi:trimeric autotransporter adhesin